ncbi:hypothetical protein [Fimbriimonas ginsengisoli]|uniref:Uncharacterized protein n=1 Tax=Fimbriimonas ginsengisoli Gsoil 348 TaxID=661478 RepID=A0A068NKQ6_FIMGI|nr:hypothetical protein [Fimbriimonas ginsengisoli]AIE83380.1 hypothetical protein OP10G_0012 [Fimbriimonas ginsengisoli Gsoil 348]
MAKGKLGKRLGVGCLGLLLVVGALLAFTGPGHDIQNMWRNGAIGAILFPEKQRTYTATNEQNLRAIHTALMLYHDSEGQFPQASGWMDAIEPRIRTSDMDASEAKKKLIRPDLAGKPGEFGYEMNDAASGKYKDDAGAKTPLIFESKPTSRNAHGDPVKDRDGYAITVDGTLLKH